MAKKSDRPEKKPSANGKKKRRDWRPAFLAHLAVSGVVTAAARHAGVSRVVAYEAQANDPEFAAAWQAALEESLDTLEQTARDRALKKSDKLLMFLLRAHRPDVFARPKEVEHTGQVVLEIVEEIVDARNSGDAPAAQNPAAPQAGAIP